MDNSKKPHAPAARPLAGRPATKEEAIARLVERDPQKAAEILREILKKR